MSVRKPMMAGNWKMHHTHLEAIQVVQKLGFRTIWQAAGHFDHIHIDVANSGPIGIGGGDGGAVGALEETGLDVKLIDWNASYEPFTGGFGGSLSYTLSRSTRSYERIQTLAGYDRPHVLNLGGNVDLGRRWIAGARGVFYSGVPGSRALGERRMFDRERARQSDRRLSARIPTRMGGVLRLTLPESPL